MFFAPPPPPPPLPCGVGLPHPAAMAPFSGLPPPPPPPPPRHRRESSTHSHDGSCLGAGPLAPGGFMQQGDDKASTCSHQSLDGSFQDMSLKVQLPGGVGGCARCRELHEHMAKMELRLTAEIARVEAEAQSATQEVVAELNRWKKDKETAWKHVGELKDQNRHLRQRSYELEVQNGHLARHLALLQEQLSMFKDNQSAFHSALKASQDRNALLAASLADAKIPKVPHSGISDIW